MKTSLQIQEHFQTLEHACLIIAKSLIKVSSDLIHVAELAVVTSFSTVDFHGVLCGARGVVAESTFLEQATDGGSLYIEASGALSAGAAAVVANEAVACAVVAHGWAESRVAVSAAIQANAANPA